MRIVVSLAVLCAVTLGTAGEGLATKTVPGVGVVVKKHPGSEADFGAPLLPPIPADFFHPGSEPFTGEIRLLGPLSVSCPSCDEDSNGLPPEAADSRIDYVEETPSEPFVMELAPVVLVSEEPIPVNSGASTSLFDVFVTIGAQSTVPDAPALGLLQCAPGAILLPGSVSSVASSFLDVRCTFTFADASTGETAGSAIVHEFRLHLQEADLPVTRVADGTEDGRIVIGLDGLTTLPFTYASSGGELTLNLRSMYAESPVTAETRSWGAVKELFH